MSNLPGNVPRDEPRPSTASPSATRLRRPPTTVDGSVLVDCDLHTGSTSPDRQARRDLHRDGLRNQTSARTFAVIVELRRPPARPAPRDRARSSWLVRASLGARRTDTTAFGSSASRFPVPDGSRQAKSDSTPAAFGSRGGRSSRQVQSRRVLVVAPAEPLRAVAEAVALHLVVAHLDHELRPHRAPPRARPCPSGSARRSAQSGSSLEQRQHALRHLGAPRRRDRARADVVEPAVVAVEAEQQRRDLLAARPSSGRRRRRSRRSCAPSP